MRISTFAWITMSLLLSVTACKSSSASSTSDIKAPSELKAAPLEGGAHLTWKDNSDNEAEFMVERKMATTDWKTVATVPFNTVQYHDANLATGMTYMYRVMAMPKQGDKGSYSNEVTFTNSTAGAAGSGGSDPGTAGASTTGASGHDAHP